MRKILAIIALTATVLILVAALLDPTIRYPYLGVSLSRDLVALQGTDPMTVMLSVETGTELLPEAELGEEPAVQDQYSLLMILREDFQAQSESAVVTYEVEEMESEQWAWKEAKLNELKGRTQVTERGIAQTPSLSFPKKSVMASSEVWSPLLISFWPKFPEGLQKAGATWHEQFSYDEEEPLTGKPISVNYNLVYKLDKFVNTDRGVLANVVVLGTLDESSDVGDTIDVRGTFKGFVLIQPETGRVYGGEYRIEERFMIKQPDLPVLRKTTYQGARFWRPMFYKMSQQKVEGGAAPAPAENPEAEPTATTQEEAQP